MKPVLQITMQSQGQERSAAVHSCAGTLPGPSIALPGACVDEAAISWWDRWEADEASARARAGAVLRLVADCVHCGLVREPRLESPLLGEGSQLGAGFQARGGACAVCVAITKQAVQPA